jgi:hypothetical protein
MESKLPRISLWSPGFDSSGLQIAQQSNEIKDLAVVLAEYCNDAI